MVELIELISSLRHHKLDINITHLLCSLYRLQTDREGSQLIITYKCDIETLVRTPSGFKTSTQ